MEIRVLGPLRVLSNGVPVDLPSGRVREILLRLAVSGSQPLSADRIAADLWPGDDRRPTTSAVRTYVARLRSALPEDVVVTRVGGYALDLSQVVLDAERFEKDVRSARATLAADPRGTVDRLALALDQWAGRAFEEVADQAWSVAAATRLEDTRLEALELEAEARLAVGGQASAVATRLAALTREHPLRERLWLHRMLALYRCGRQADALACYQQVRQILDDELGLEPGPELRDLERAILVQDPSLDEAPAAATPPRASTGPAPPTVTRTVDLIGRDSDRAMIEQLLETHRVVTLTGPGGVGKSRLAAEVIRDAVRGREHGGVSVDVSLATDEGALIEAIAASMGVAQRGALSLLELLLDALRLSDAVVVLDNCEHATKAVGAIVTELARACPSVRVLVTSRSPLNVPPEVVHQVRPLAVPLEDATIEEIRSAEAVRLFDLRARMASSSFALTDANAATVARICRRLDGLPFAIELAAARMRVLAPLDLELRLDERFGLLVNGRSGARHATLRDAIAWSYELLDPTERRAFRNLSVFTGTFDLGGAGAVTDLSEDQVVDSLAGLVDRSLLAVDVQGEHVWYRMLETVRAFGRERLESEGELVPVRNRHLSYLAHLAERAADLLHGPHEATGHELLATMRDDMHAAFDWSIVAGRWADGARMVARIPWERVGRTIQWHVTRWAVRLVAEQPTLDPRLDARVHAAATIGHWLAGEAVAAKQVGDQALLLAESTDDQTFVETALAVAWMRWEAGDVEGAARLYLPLADPDLGEKVTADVAAYCLGGMVMGMTESGLLAGSGEAAAVANRLTEAAIRLADVSGCPAALALSHLARAYSRLDADPELATRELEFVAAIDGLALPTWALHARSHLARIRAASGDRQGLVEELTEILESAVAAVDEMHLRLLGGFVGGALTVAGLRDATPTLLPLAVEAFTGRSDDGWRRDVAERLGATGPRSPVPSLSGLALERAIRTAILDLRRLSSSQ